MKRFSILIRYCIGILEWFLLGKSYNTERKPFRIITARARWDCVVNKFSISLVCGLRAQAADTITFCFCLWGLFNFYMKRAPGPNHFRSRYHPLSRINAPFHCFEQVIIFNNAPKCSVKWNNRSLLSSLRWSSRSLFLK